MTCEEHQEQISELIDNELEEQQSPALFSHLSTCEECRRFLHTTLRFRAGLQEEALPLAPTRLDQKVLGTTPAVKRYVLDRTARRSILWKRRVSLPLPAAALIMVLLMVIVAATSPLWYPRLHPQAQTQAQTVYVTTFPAVEVDGYYQRPNTRIQ